MVADRDWDGLLEALPGTGAIRLTRNELLLLDWVLCMQSGLMISVAEDIVGDWHEFRMRVWRGILDQAHLAEPEGIMFEIDETDAIVLLVALPTTFNWGAEDCGFSLKAKLATSLDGNYTDPILEREVQENASENATEAVGDPKGEAGAATGDITG